MAASDSSSASASAFGNNSWSSSGNVSSSQRAHDELGKLKPVHVLVAVGVLVATVMAAFVARTVSWRLRQRSVARIPRHVMPLLRPGDLPARQRTIIMAELVRSKRTAVVLLPAPGTPPPGWAGWGEPRGEDAALHYREAAARTYLLLEDAAARRAGGALARAPWMSVREWVCGALVQCGAVQERLANRYIAEYERARFGPDEFTAAEYTSFMRRFTELLHTLEYGSGTADGPCESAAGVRGVRGTRVVSQSGGVSIASSDDACATTATAAAAAAVATAAATALGAGSISSASAAWSRRRHSSSPDDLRRRKGKGKDKEPEETVPALNSSTLYISYHTTSEDDEDREEAQQNAEDIEGYGQREGFGQGQDEGGSDENTVTPTKENVV
eukprot:TRINITY_DN1371_c0_g1_i1.p1 TRINITY_DN1371_c0_g1~~TRINITY_DN1371_c0_g1_i1.p1  ORF type:complete len:387 (-),score=84.60 TRINITY_DN1371_c0_g1_i1:7-1167(-)